jgi:hypothetical protein
LRQEYVAAVGAFSECASRLCQAMQSPEQFACLHSKVELLQDRVVDAWVLYWCHLNHHRCSGAFALQDGFRGYLSPGLLEN